MPPPALNLHQILHNQLNSHDSKYFSKKSEEFEEESHP